VRRVERSGDGQVWTFSADADLLPYIIPKGSIAIDGVSLTVIECGRGGLVATTIVPYTFEHTVVGGYRSGTRVNVETDILGKYVIRRAGRARSNGSQ
jgi:riboflavin synthase